MLGWKACWSGAGMAPGVWLIFIGVDQVKPPSLDMEKAMLLYSPPEKRPSCQTAYRLPELGSTATLNEPVPLFCARTWPVFGSVTARGTILAARIGWPLGSQVWPLSLERSRLRFMSN